MLSTSVGLESLDSIQAEKRFIQAL